jgi:hypothetical protein
VSAYFGSVAYPPLKTLSANPDISPVKALYLLLLSREILYFA